MSILKDNLYDYDNQDNVEEEFMVCHENQFTVNDYLYGKCHLFAWQLHQLTGLKIGLFIDDQRFEHAPGLEHAFCYINDDYIVDAQGIRSKNEALNNYCHSTFDFIEAIDDGTLIQEWINKGLLDDYTNEKEKTSLHEYVKTFVSVGLINYK